MLFFDRIDFCEGTDFDKTSLPKEYVFFHYWYFLNNSFKFQPNASNRCRDLLMMSINLDNNATLNVKCSDYCCIISLISKNEDKNSMQNADLAKKMWDIVKYKNLLSRIKMSKDVLPFWNIETEKNKFHHNNTPILLKHVNIEKVLVSSKISFGEKDYKYLIGHYI